MSGKTVPPHLGQLAGQENPLGSLDAGSCSWDCDICRQQSCEVSHLPVPPLVPCPPTQTAAPCLGGPGGNQRPKTSGTQPCGAGADTETCYLQEIALNILWCNKEQRCGTTKGTERDLLPFPLTAEEVDGYSQCHLYWGDSEVESLIFSVVHLVRLLTHLGEINNSPFIHRYGVYLLELLCLIRSCISCALETMFKKKKSPTL